MINRFCTFPFREKRKARADLSMSSKISFNVITDKSQYKKGENITGTVHLELLYPYEIKKIAIQFNKIFTCHLRENGNLTNYIYNNELILYESKKNLNEIGSGHHRFPFCFINDRSGDGSTAFSDNSTGSLVKFANSFKIEANLFFKDENLPAKKVVKTLTIHSKNESTKKMTEKISIMSCICLQSANILLVAYSDKENYLPSEKIIFTSRLSTKDYRIKRTKTRMICNITINTKKVKYKSSLLVSNCDNLKIEKGDCISEIKIPENVPASVNEKYLKVSYLLESFIFINRGSPIKITRNIFVEQKPGKLDKYLGIGALKGILFPVKKCRIE